MLKHSLSNHLLSLAVCAAFSTSFSFAQGTAMTDLKSYQAEALKRAQENHWKWKSPYSVKETVDRLLAVVNRYPEVLKYDRIDQQAVAKISGHDIPPAETVYFQNSQLVGKLLSTNVMVMRELPIKTTVWEDENGQVWLQTPDIDRMDKEYELNGADGAIQAIYDLLPGWVEETTQK